MKLLHIIGSVDPRSGGPIEGVLRQNEALALEGERQIVSLDPANAPFLADLPIKVHALGPGPADRADSPWPWVRFRYAPPLVSWLKSNVRSFDAVIVNGLWNYSTMAAARVLPGCGVPYFVFTHGMMDPWFRDRYPLKHLAKQALWLLSEGRLLSRAKAVLFTTDEERRLARGVFWGHRYTERVVGYGTTEPPPPDPRQAPAFQAAVPSLQGRPYLLFLSRIHPKKGCDLLISAFAACSGLHPELQLVMAGPDQVGQKPELMRQAQLAGVADRIHWPGMLTGDAKWGAIRGAMAFVLPSHQENFGIVVAEAMACGVPVLITDKVNIWREVEGDGAGLVEPDTRAGVEALLRRFLGLSGDQVAAMQRGARECFRRNFDIQVTAHEMLNTMRALAPGLPD